MAPALARPGQNNASQPLNKGYIIRRLNEPFKITAKAETDKAHRNGQQSGTIGKTVMKALTQVSSDSEDITWEQVDRLDLEIASEDDRLAGLILLSEAVHHITTQRKKSQRASRDQLVGLLKHRGEVLATSKKYSATSSSLVIWAEELIRPTNQSSQQDQLQLPAVNGLHPSPPA